MATLWRSSYQRRREATAGGSTATPSTTIPTTGRGPVGGDGYQSIIMVSPTGVTTIVGPDETAALLRQGWRWPTVSQQTAYADRVQTVNPGFYGAGTSPAAKEAEFDRASAAAIQNTLREYGLEELIPLLDTWIRAGASWAEIEGMLMDPSSAAGAVVDRKYPELRLRRAADKSPISIRAIREYKDQARSLARSYDLPDGYITDERISKWIVNDTSIREQEEKILAGIVAVRNDHPDTARELQRLYGLSEGALALAVLDDSNEPLDAIRRKVATAQIGGASLRSGFGQLDVGEAETLARQGVTADQASQQLSTLAGARELFTPIDRGEDVITRQEQLATFDNSAAARRRIEDRARRRQAAFQGGGAISTSREGMAGLSTSR